MSADVNTALHINRPDSIAVRRIMHCPTCDCCRRFSAVDQLWYGPSWTCLACGDGWSEGERLERPFRRDWRKESRRRARETWARAVRVSGPDHLAWLQRQMAEYPQPAEVTS